MLLSGVWPNMQKGRWERPLAAALAQSYFVGSCRCVASWADGEPAVPALKHRADMKTDKYFGLNTTTSAYIPISKTTKKDSESADSESFLWLRGWDLNHMTSGLWGLRTVLALKSIDWPKHMPMHPSRPKSRQTWEERGRRNLVDIWPIINVQKFCYIK